MTTTPLDRLELSRRYAWIGPAAGVAAMVALFIFGAVNQYPALMVMSGTLAVVLVAVGVSIRVSLDRRLAALRAER